MAEGASERFGIVVSSEALRLKPHAIDVKTPVNPIHWFLNGKDDVRSSYYLEDAATEFHVQGLELDWACVTWDADFRYTPHGWEHWSFRGVRWNHSRKREVQNYLKNSYRVLLTRARQGMVIVVPPGDLEDRTRDPAFYNPTFEYLKDVGFTIICMSCLTGICLSAAFFPPCRWWRLAATSFLSVVLRLYSGVRQPIRHGTVRRSMQGSGRARQHDFTMALGWIRGGGHCWRLSRQGISSRRLIQTMSRARSEAIAPPSPFVRPVGRAR
jgi:hypothetical protein